MQAKLTVSLIKSLQPHAKPYEVVDSEIKGFLLRVQPTGRMTYYYAYRSTSGQRKRIKLGTHGPAVTVAMAREAAVKAAGDVVRGVDVQAEKKSRVKAAIELRNRTLKVFLDDHYAPWIRAHQKTGDATINRINQSFSEFLGLPLDEIDLRRVDRFRTDAISRGLQPATVNRSINCLRGLMTRAVEWGVLGEHPLEGLKPLKIDKSPKVRYLTDSEEAALLTALSERDQRMKNARERANAHRTARGHPLLPTISDQAYADRLTPMVILSLKTGLRRGELFDLRWPDVDIPGRLLTVRGEDSKSGQTRYVPLSPIALSAITGWRDQCESSAGRVFPADDGGRLDNVRTSWDAVLVSAGIEKFRWHDMRHHFASKLVMKGVPLNTVRELCGHADSNTTLRYAHLAESHKADAVELLG